MMKVNKLLLSLARKKNKLPPEFKILLSILLFFLVNLIRFIELIKNIFINTKSFIKNKIQNFPKLSLHLFSKTKAKNNKKILKNKTSAIIPLIAKLKYFSLGIFISTFFIFLPLVTLIFIQELPNPRELSLRQMPQTTKIYDRNKVLLYEIYADEKRTLVPLADIPLHLRQATLAIEDKNFYNHPGFDIASIVRALKENIQSGKPLQGGSTITQQLIKSSFFTSEKKVSRKIKEIVLSFWTEHIYSKDEILEMYFNQIPYGGTAWGVEAASDVYFGKHVKDLSLAESTFLAGITQAPSLYSPYGSDPSIWKNRQKSVIKNMVDLGYISKKQAENALKEKLTFQQPKEPLLAPHFVMYIKDYLIQRHGIGAVEKGGLSVITTLDIKKQDMAQKIVKDQVEADAYLNLTNGAALVTDPKNGDILAMVGSHDFNDEKSGNVNVTIQPRQPGSTVKVITYSTALLKNMTPATILDDTQTTFYAGAGSPPYNPENYDGKYYGKVTLRFALANSLNLPAVKVLRQVGVDEMMKLGKDMGITSWTDPSLYGLSVTLGSAETKMTEMATVFGTLSNGGKKVELNPLLLVTDSKGNILEQKNDVQPVQVLPEGIAYIISDIISDNKTRSAAFGPNSALNIPGRNVSVKTGTSDNKRDNWTIGYTKDYVVTVWVGNNDNSAMNPTLASGITGAAPIWHNIMVNLIGKSPEVPQKIPTDVVAKSCLGRIEYFLKGTENSVSCGARPTAKIYSPQ